MLGFSSLALALAFACASIGCANLDCPAGQQLAQEACICTSTLEPPKDGACVKDSCDATSCPCTATGIRDAIARGGTQLIDCEEGVAPVQVTDTIVIDNDVTLDGRGNLTVLGVDYAFHVFEARRGEAELVGLTIAQGNGGVRVLEGAVLRITDCVVTDNQSSPVGGGGISNDGQLTLVGTVVENNIARGGEGGGIFNSSTGELALQGGTIVRDNLSEKGAGGGIANNRGVVTLINTEVSRNRSGDPGGDGACGTNGSCANGGGIANENGEVRIENSTITGNTSPWYGGGLSVEGALGRLDVIASTVVGNRTVQNDRDREPNHGGGLWCRDGQVLSEDTLWVWNRASRAGGGIYIQGEGAELTMKRSTVAGNVAERSVGGGIRVSDQAFAVITNSTIFANASSDASGGDGIFVGDASAEIRNSTVSNNNSGIPTNTTGVDISVIQSDLKLVQTIIHGVCALNTGQNAMSGDFNIESPGDTCNLGEANDLVDVPPDELNLATTLGNNGGLTLTLMLGWPSIAADYLPQGPCAELVDQRGEDRPQGGDCDIGAVELRADEKEPR